MAGARYYLIMNPSSGSGRGRRVCERILSVFNNKELEFDYKITQGPEEATFISAKAIKHNWDVVVAVGGDGTICEVISGFFSNGLSSHNAKLGVLHVGTSPDFNRYHNIPLNLDRAIDVLSQGKSKLIDIGKITFTKKPAESAISYFGSNVNVGLGPLIATKANSRYRKYLGDFLGTLSASVISLINFKGIDLKIKIDGQKVDFEKLINLTVGKDPYLASGMRIFSDIAPDDGRLYILSIKKASFISLIANIYKLYIGDFLKVKGTCIEYGKEVEIDCDTQNIFVEFDGDVRGYLPARIEVIPKALEVITE